MVVAGGALSVVGGAWAVVGAGPRGAAFGVAGWHGGEFSTGGGGLYGGWKGRGLTPAPHAPSVGDAGGWGRAMARPPGRPPGFSV